MATYSKIVALTGLAPNFTGVQEIDLSTDTISGLVQQAVGIATAGDMLYSNGTNVWQSLSIGTAAQTLKVNAGGTAPEWVSDIAAAANPRAHADDTTVAPATAGAPTVAEMQIFSTAGVYTDILMYYTGDDLPASDPTYVYWVDGAGTVTELDAPGAGDNLVTADLATTTNRNHTFNHEMRFEGTGRKRFGQDNTAVDNTFALLDIQNGSVTMQSQDNDGAPNIGLIQLFSSDTTATARLQGTNATGSTKIEATGSELLVVTPEVDALTAVATADISSVLGLVDAATGESEFVVNKYVQTIAIADWGLALAGEQTLLIPVLTHKLGIDPVVSVREGTGPYTEVGAHTLSFAADGSVTITIVEGTAFDGKVVIS